MTLANVKFKPLKETPAFRRKMEDAVSDYASYLQRNGQIIGEEWSYAWQKGILNVYVEMPRPDSCESKHNSDWVNEHLAKTSKLLQSAPQWTIIEDLKHKRFPALKSCSSLVLCSRLGDCYSPVKRGGSGESIPLYLLPIDQYARQYLYFWNRMERCLWFIWLESEALEIPAYRQTCDPQSEHFKEGRRLCAMIEKATGIPTYCYQERFWGRKAGEKNRPCPICGKNWRVRRNKSDKTKGFGQFDFQCETCRIVSRLPDSDDNVRYARIGEFKGKAKRRATR